jgi:hypothetical protein
MFTGRRDRRGLASSWESGTPPGAPPNSNTSGPRALARALSLRSSMSTLRPTMHIERVPALRSAPSRRPIPFGTALLVALAATTIVTVGIARLAGAAQPAVSVTLMR